MRHFYFGTPNRRLYGVHHEPPPAKARGTRVLLCYPGTREYNSLHWSFRNLSAMIAREGFDVMRFDYFGTGDSAGEPIDADLDGWAEDVKTAADELLDASNAKPLKLVGMRLGGSVAVRAVERGLAVDDLVLWDPILRGGPYLAELELLDRQRNVVLLHGAEPRPNELLGYPISNDQRRAIAAYEVAPPPVSRLALFTSSRTADHAGFIERSLASGTNARHEVVTDDAASRANTADGATLHVRMLAAITKYLSEAP